MKNFQKLVAVVTAVTAICMTLSGCGGGNSATVSDTSNNNSNTSSESSGEKINVSIMQFKVEINDALKKAANTYMSVNPNVQIYIETVGGGNDYGAALRAKMQGEQPTIFNIGGPQDLKDWEEKLEDLTDEPWVEEAADGVLKAVSKDNKVFGLPYNLEGYGLIYNKNIFADAGIDESTLNSYDGIKAAFTLLDSKIKSGELKDKYPMLEAVVEYPGKEKWVSGLHALNASLANEFDGAVAAYEAKEVAFTHGDALKALFDLQTDFTKDASNKGNLNAIDYATQVGGGLAIERVAVVQQGNWIYPEVINVDPELAENLGIMPLPIKGVVEDRIPVGVPNYWAINKDRPENEKAAAKDFLNWLYQSDEGKQIVCNEFFFIPPFKNYDGLNPPDTLGKIVKQYSDDGKIMPWVFMGFPVNWGEGTFGAEFQNYLSGTLTWEELIEKSKTKWAEARR